MFKVGDRVVLKSYEELEGISSFTMVSHAIMSTCAVPCRVTGVTTDAVMIEDLFVPEVFLDLVPEPEICVGDWVRIKSRQQLRKIARSENSMGFLTLRAGMLFNAQMFELSGLNARVEGVRPVSAFRCRKLALSGNPVFENRDGRYWTWTEEMVTKVREL